MLKPIAELRVLDVIQSPHFVHGRHDGLGVFDEVTHLVGFDKEDDVDPTSDPTRETSLYVVLMVPTLGEDCGCHASWDYVVAQRINDHDGGWHPHNERIAFTAKGHPSIKEVDVVGRATISILPE